VIKSIRREVTLPAPVARVWRALTDSREIAEWMYPNDFKPEVGHRFTLHVPTKPDFDGIVRGEIVDCVPDKTLRFTWAGGDVVGTTVQHELEPVDGGTILRFEHTGFDLDAAWGEPALRGAEYGWTMMLGRLGDLVNQQSDSER
jgi:uncharacterized protein YndB with AHSA1/START domain